MLTSSDLVAIMAGLLSHPVRRLKQSWNLVPSLKIRLLDNMESKYSPANQKSLREGIYLCIFKVDFLAHDRAKAPCIPVLVQFVGDLIRLRENPDKLDDKIINFGKRRVMAKIFRQLHMYKSEKYQLKPVLGI